MTPTTAVIPTILSSSSLAALLAPLALLAITAVLVTLVVLVAGLVSELSDAPATDRLRRVGDDVNIVIRNAA